MNSAFVRLQAVVVAIAVGHHGPQIAGQFFLVRLTRLLRPPTASMMRVQEAVYASDVSAATRLRPESRARCSADSA